jgi:peptide/nickel transport system ATP-binding protein
MSKDILLVDDYKVYYSTFSGAVRAVDGLSLRIISGNIVGIIGESGSGKSTFAQSLVLPKHPMFIAGGKAIFLEKYDLTRISVRERRSILLTKLSYIPQYAMDSLPTIKKLKTFIRDIASEKNVSYSEILDKFRERLKQVNLSDNILDMYPLQLSGGMRQRVLIAISTIFRPALLIADEPTSALDVVSQRQVLELLKDLKEQDLVDSIMIISHDIASIRQIADRLAIMYAGKIVEEGESEKVIHDPLHPYTSLLIRSVPSLGINYKETRLKGLGGFPPNLINPPKGCRFHPRCPFATDICRAKEPPTIQIGDRRVSCWLYVER